jgi:hypothetical protein
MTGKGGTVPWFGRQSGGQMRASSQAGANPSALCTAECGEIGRHPHRRMDVTDDNGYYGGTVT